MAKTAQKTLRFKRNASITGKRGEDVICWQVVDGPTGLLPALGETFTPSSGSESGRDPPDRPGTFFEDGDDGVSVLLIETGSEERISLD